MNIEEKIKSEYNRHYEKIRQLNDILKMYNASVRDNAALVERNVNQAAAYGIDPDRIVSYEEVRQYENPYAKQIEEIKSSIESENKLHERNISALTIEKQKIEQKRVEVELAREKERQQRAIELISLQQEINRMENERLEIEKRLRTISSETLGAYVSKQISERYPDEYQKFQQNREQVRSYSSRTTQISDIREKFNKVAEDLKFYKDMLPAYESYYQRFEAVKNERHQQEVSEIEQKRIYNLIHKAENNRLNENRSLYTAWDLGDKIIPSEYQDLSYEQVESLLNQKAAEEKARQAAQATRDELIGRAIRKDLMVPMDYNLSSTQIKNLSGQFASYSNEELQEFISGAKKQETIAEIQPHLSEHAAPQPIQQQSISKSQISEIKGQSTSNYEEFQQSLINFIENKSPNFGNVSEIISVSGYPDSIYETRFESGEIHPITITTDEKKLIEKQSQNRESSRSETIQPIQQHTILGSSTIKEGMQAEEKSRLINDIIESMLKAGEFHDSELDISQKMRDIEHTKETLSSKSMEELEWALSFYNPQQDEISHNDIKKKI